MVNFTLGRFTKLLTMKILPILVGLILLALVKQTTITEVCRFLRLIENTKGARKFTYLRKGDGNIFRSLLNPKHVLRKFDLLTKVVYVCKIAT